jgi:hypothetical protein
MPKAQIVLNVSGGLVQDVFCSDPAAEVIVVDWDFADGEHQANVSRAEVLPLEELAGTDAEAAIEEANFQTVVRWTVVA